MEHSRHQRWHYAHECANWKRKKLKQCKPNVMILMIPMMRDMMIIKIILWFLLLLLSLSISKILGTENERYELNDNKDI